jgi:hypothetical protein
VSEHKIAPLYERCESKDLHHKCYRNKNVKHIHKCICDRTWEEKDK